MITILKLNLDKINTKVTEEDHNNLAWSTFSHFKHVCFINGSNLQLFTTFPDFTFAISILDFIAFNLKCS